MTNPCTLSPSGFEILVARELRKVSIEPVGMRRRARPVKSTGGADYAFDLVGRLEAYGRRWSALIECRSVAGAVQAGDVDALRRRADAAPASSALLFTTSEYAIDAVRRADELRIALLRVIDAQRALLAQGMIEAGPLPAWVPEFTIELGTLEGTGVRNRLLEADRPEPILQQLRAR